MAFQFKKNESVPKSVNRLGRKRIERALCDLQHSERLESVHAVRKQIKELRALVRLVRSAIAKSDYRRSAKLMRKAAGYLATARDARVKILALDGLIHHVKRGGLAPQSFRDSRAILSDQCRKRQAELSESGAPRHVVRLLKTLRKQLHSIRLKRSGWRALAPGIHCSYREGRRGYWLSRRDGSPEQLHEWRKRVKDLGYQIGLLCPIWPERMAAAEAALDGLGECLGDYHDLALLGGPGLTEALRQQAPEEAEALAASVTERQKELRVRALVLGATFYDEKPATFCNRLGQYWKRWRHEPKCLALAA